MIAIFYDTETTGLPLFKQPSEHPDQPHIVQLAAKLVDLDSRKVIKTINHIVKPDGWTISSDVAEIHGITTEQALDVGLDESDVLASFLRLWEQASIRVGHNEPFDARIVRIACMRHADELMADKWKAGASACTQILSTPILKLPPTPKMVAAGFKKHKSANLGEAYEYFIGKKLDGAHNALVDVDACMEVYYAIQDAKRIVACVNACAGYSTGLLSAFSLKTQLGYQEQIENELERVKKENARLQAELDRVTKLNPIDEYHEDYHSVLWLTVPIEEPPAYIGSPLDDDFPDYVTHFAHMPHFVCPIKDHEHTEKKPTGQNY